jgi:RHS repeat-associated protein
VFGGGGLCLPCLIKSILHTVLGAPVDAEDGNMYHSFNDLQMAGRGVPLAFSRTYNSQAASVDGPLGFGWSDNLGASLSVSGSTAVLAEENGAQTTFTLSGGVWSPPPRDLATLTQNGDGTWTVVRHTQDTLVFDVAGQLVSETDLNGNQTTYTYSGGLLTGVTDASGRFLTLAYSGGHIASVKDANVSPARVVRYRYSGAGDLTDVIDVNGGDTHFRYDANHRMTAMQDPKCVATAGCPGIVTHYDAQGRVDSQKDQLGRRTTFSYAGDPTSATGGTTTITDPVGHETFDAYQYGLRVSHTLGYGTTAAATTTYEYDPATTQPTLVVDPDGHGTSMTYDANGNMLSRTDPLGHVTTWTYNGFNEPLTVTDPRGVTTTYTYDGRGNRTSISTPCADCSPTLTQTTTYTYGDSSHPGDLTAMTDPDGKTSTYSYDANGDRTSTTDPLGDMSTSTYNADGWRTSSVSPNGNLSGCGCAASYTTTYSYIIAGTTKVDAFGDLHAVTDALGHVTRASYDADRNRISTTDADGNTTTYVYDLANELITTIRPGTPTTTLATGYNADGTVHDQLDGAGNATLTYGYDGLGRLVGSADALGHTTTLGYDPTGNVISRQDPGGNCYATTPVGCTTMTYDAANQLTSITYSDGTTPNVTYGYDADGQRTTMTDGTGTTTWTYNELHQLVSTTNGHGDTVSATYDPRGNVVSVAYPDGHTVGRGYDADGRYTSTTDWLSHTSTFSYDADGNLIGETLGDGVTDASTFNHSDQLEVMSYGKGATTLFKAVYTRDANGQVTKDTSQPSTQGGYHYTSLDQLCYTAASSTSTCDAAPAGAKSYQYDAADNLVTNASNTTQSFNAADELCWTAPAPATGTCGSMPSGTTAFSYDARGNRTSTSPPSGPASTYTFDQADRLVGLSNGASSVAYTYDGAGLRASKTVGATTTDFTWGTGSGAPLLSQSSATATTDFVLDPTNLPLEQIVNNTVQWFVHDELGSTRILAGPTGKSLAKFDYTPYGTLASSTGTATTPFMFAGQYEDAESGLYYMRARYYDPITGQFLTRDPAVAQTLAPYRYADSNPVTNTDPSGQECHENASVDGVSSWCDHGEDWAAQQNDVGCTNFPNYRATNGSVDLTVHGTCELVIHECLLKDVEHDSMSYPYTGDWCSDAISYASGYADDASRWADAEFANDPVGRATICGWASDLRTIAALGRLQQTQNADLTQWQRQQVGDGAEFYAHFALELLTHVFFGGHDSTDP